MALVEGEMHENLFKDYEKDARNVLLACFGFSWLGRPPSLKQ